MKKLLIFLCALFVFAYGVAVGRYQLFPFEYLSHAMRIVSDSEPSAHPRVLLFEAFSPDVKYVMIGDSNTYHALWSEFFPNASIANRGVRGSSTDRILQRMQSIFSITPETAFIMVGVNDLGRGNEPGAVLENYVSIVEQLQARGINVIIQSTLECSRDRGDDLLARVRELNKLLSSFAAQSGITFIDLNAVMSDEDGLKRELTYDGLHLNAKGYSLWVEALTPYINATCSACEVSLHLMRLYNENSS